MNKLFQIKSYLKFLTKSTNQHDVHSPFIYNLVTKCFYKKTSLSKISQIEAYRSSINKIADSDKRYQEFLKTNRVPTISNKKAHLLIRIVEYFSSNTILEIGTSKGISTVAMKIGNPKSNITSINKKPNANKIIQEEIENQYFTKTNFHVGSFNTTFSEIFKNQSYDLIHFNEKLTKKVVPNYFNLYNQNIHNDSVMIFNDIHRSKQAEKAWEIIKQSPLVAVTVDTFHLGFVFFRKEQRKEHFIIRV